MTQLELFVNDAIKTESRIDEVKVNKEFFEDVRLVMINAGNLMDAIKKHVFYNKPYDIPQMVQYVLELNQAIINLNELTAETVVDDEDVLKVNPRMFHSIVGIATESTELLEALDISGKDMDSINIAEEFGDLDWYKAIGVDELGISWDTILDTVIKKLKQRYPNNFTSEDAINRNLNDERNILDEMEIGQTDSSDGG